VLDGPVAGTLTPAPDDPPADLLDDERTGLKDIARFLMTPAWSGLALSRDDIARLGRSAQLPRGFGDRTQMLTNLLRSAAEYDGLGAVLTRLDQQVDEWRAHYQLVEAEGAWTLDAVAAFWQARLDTTEAVINRMRTAVPVSPDEAAP